MSIELTPLDLNMFEEYIVNLDNYISGVHIGVEPNKNYIGMLDSEVDLIKRKMEKMHENSFSELNIKCANKKNRKKKCVYYIDERQRKKAVLAAHIWGGEFSRSNLMSDCCEYAIVLHDYKSNTYETINLVFELKNKGVKVGIIPLYGDNRDWSTLVLHLLSDKISTEFRYSFNSEKINLGNSQNNEYDVTLFQGHSGPADMRVNNEITLCGKMGMSASSNDSLPCWSEEKCYKQPLLGREASSKYSLKSIGDLCGRVTILSGCNLSPLSSSWLPIEHSLIFQIIESGGYVIASSGLLRISYNYDLLFLALLSEGNSLGSVVESINDIREQTNIGSKQSDMFLGSYVLLGNPCFNFSVEKVSNKSVGDILDNNVTAKLLRKNILTKYTLFNNGISRIIKEDIVLSDKNENTDTLKHKIIRMMNVVQYWNSIISGNNKKYNETFFDNSEFNSISRDFYNFLITGLNIINENVMIGNEIFHLDYLLSKNIHIFQSSIMRFLNVIVTCHGTYLFKMWQDYYMRDSESIYHSKCLCSNGYVVSTRHRSMFFRDLDRLILECIKCGVVGESGELDLVKVTKFPRLASPGDKLCYIFNVEKDKVSTLSRIYIESYFKNDSTIKSKVIESSNSNSIELTLNIPHEIKPNVYVICAIFLINGELRQIRNTIKII
ncbi:Hypothetical protein VIBNISFn27_870051 [Vibrio nigripulchritudo SFn27]|nr:hypothetical protein [Vibrio nigripulchritudo]CCN85667.1 Hypothetical protein VIBNIBLFn1_960051 [Vibrio nigripulchritudo BLFn1]CCN91079.1 Hypothetical protein VIBNISFn27_870051 [Vibrio nigripulchritudo SFn27]CCN93547.1 Hypothetical protein VIBNIENn2_240019 [Vibrio nigripulchritudo ENn2]CCO40086.1 Hypothetical protein VIBNISFn135_220052 [Vibrio nigripulchritudo SFn135]CCO54158.1 Hypothetical protein VIBNIWn13_640051 [Vibrio nigripulchritudo Wn13]